MTLTIAWWWIPVAFLLAGSAGFLYAMSKESGDFDYFHPFLALMSFVLGVVSAIAFLIGRWLS